METVTSGALQKILSGTNEANFQPIVSFVRCIPSGTGKSARMQIVITDGADTATAVIATSKLADMVEGGCRFLKLNDFYIAEKHGESSTRVITLLGAQVVSVDDQAATPTPPAAAPSTTTTTAIATAANPFTCNFTGAGLLTTAVLASSSSFAPPMVGSTSIQGPWIHASAEQLATRRILTVKRRSAPTPVVPDAASKTESTTPASMSNPFTTAAPSFSPLSAPYTNLFGSYPTASTESPEPSTAIGKEGIEKIGTAAIAAWSSSPTNPYAPNLLPYILLPYAAKIATLTERVRVLETCHPCLPCVVCLENPKNVVIFPCHHLCVCQSCSNLITQECPVCRGTVESKTVVYVS